MCVYIYIYVQLKVLNIPNLLYIYINIYFVSVIQPRSEGHNLHRRTSPRVTLEQMPLWSQEEGSVAG